MKNEECLELKNINYQTMLLNNKSNIDSNTVSDCSEKIENFLNKEKEININKPWSKLSKANKLKKLIHFSGIYKKKNNLSLEEEIILKKCLLESLDRKKLQKIKDVLYDVEKGVIIDIPKLIHLKDKKRFTIKRDKKNNTLSSLAPKTKKIKKFRKKVKSGKTNKNDNKINNKIKKIKKIKKKPQKTKQKTPIKKE